MKAEDWGIISNTAFLQRIAGILGSLTVDIQNEAANTTYHAQRVAYSCQTANGLGNPINPTVKAFAVLAIAHANSKDKIIGKGDNLTLDLDDAALKAVLSSVFNTLAVSSHT